MTIIKIQSRGQFTIPKAIRQEAGIEPGDPLEFEVVSPTTIRMTVKGVIPDVPGNLQSTPDQSTDNKNVRFSVEDDAAPVAGSNN